MSECLGNSSESSVCSVFIIDYSGGEDSVCECKRLNSVDSQLRIVCVGGNA